MRTDYEYIVLGCGGVGAGTLYWLARRAGRDVLGLEQFNLFHFNGGSQDFSRVIRLTYHDAAYTALTPHAYETWHALEEESGVQVITRTGSVEFAEVGSRYQGDVDRYAAAMDAAAISYERIDGDEMMRRYPQFRFDKPLDVLIQDQTGIVDPHRGNGAHIAMARYYGATVLENCKGTSIEPVDGGVVVHTEDGSFTCRRLIITAGAWVDQILASVGKKLHVTVTKEQVTYYATPNLREFAVGRFPIFLCHAESVYYGFPVYGEIATKGAIDAKGPAIDIDRRTFVPTPELEAQLDGWLSQHIPGFLGPKLYTRTCLYTMTKDRDFVIDFLPEHPQIIVYCGAGHAYKFSGILGKIMSEMAIDEQTQYPIAPFTLDRPAINDPAFPAQFHI